MFPVHMESSPSCSKINDKLLLIAKSIDLLGNPVYSISCERACGVGWPHPRPPLHQRWRGGKGDCSIRFEDTALWNDIPTINRQGHTRYIGCRIGAEPEDGLSHFCPIGHAPQRHPARDALPDLLTAHPSLVHRPPVRAIVHSIDPN